MPELPALPLGAPVRGTRTKGRPGRSPLQKPNTDAQASRFQPSFDRLSAAFEAERLAIADDPAALEPERVLVLEVAGELDEFIRVVQKVDGLEFLAEQLEEKVEPDEFARLDTKGRPRPY